MAPKEALRGIELAEATASKGLQDFFELEEKLRGSFPKLFKGAHRTENTMNYSSWGRLTTASFEDVKYLTSSFDKWPLCVRAVHLGLENKSLMDSF